MNDQIRRFLRRLPHIIFVLTLGCGGGTGSIPVADTAIDARNDEVSGDVGRAADTALSDTPQADTRQADSGIQDLAADVTEADLTHPFFDFVGEVRLSQSNTAEGAFQGAGANAWFWDGPDSFNANLVLLEEEGACQFWVMGLPSLCDPACETSTEWCGPDGACHPKRARLSAGVLTFDGLLQDLAASVSEEAWYTFEGLDNQAPLFDPGDPILVTAAGDAIPGFQTEVRGVGPMVLPSTTYELVDDQDNVFSWEPQNDDAIVETAFLVGWHGSPPPAMIWCAAPEEDGALVVSRHMVEMFPTAGCMGLFPHTSWARRVHRSVVTTPSGPVEILTEARAHFTLLHGDCR